MKITFVQNDREKAESDRAIKSGLSLRKAKAGAWILPPGMSAGGKFTVVDCPMGEGVFVETFDTIDGALLYVLGISNDDRPAGSWDREGALKDWGNFV